MNDKVYIHEFIDIIGHNRARYMHHMTANWCPVAREERNQLCFGVWGTVGSTGRWPEVVNMWELDGWDGLVGQLRPRVRPRHAAGPVARRVVGGRGVAAARRRRPHRRARAVDPADRRARSPTASAASSTPTSWSRVPAAGRASSSTRVHDARGAGLRRARPRSWSAPSAWRWSTTPRPSSSGPSRTGRRGPSSSRPGWPTAARSPLAPSCHGDCGPTGEAACWSTRRSARCAPAASPRSSDRIPLDQL